MVDIDVCGFSHLKEELAWAVGKWLRIISTINYLKIMNLKRGVGINYCHKK